MAIWHINELAIALCDSGWNVEKRTASGSRGIPEIWQLTLAAIPDRRAFVDFHMEDDETIADQNDIASSYGCALRYNPNIALHFYKHRKDWDVYLKEFADQMRDLANAGGVMEKTA